MFNRLFILAIILSPSIALPMSAMAQSCSRPGVIQLAPGYSYANLYESASTSSRVLSQLREGDQICILGSGDYFHKVRFGAITGYIVRR
jgi:hypothetical protein